MCFSFHVRWHRGYIVFARSSIRNPGTYYFNATEPRDWTSPANNALWLDGTKTLFDPCPAGWRVPKNGAGNISPWHAFSLDNSTWNGESVDPSGGRTFDRTVVYGPTAAWYPANGVRYGNTSTLNECSVYGYAWSSSLSATSTFRLLLHISFVEVARSDYGWRAHGFPVRCIRE